MTAKKVTIKLRCLLASLLSALTISMLLAVPCVADAATRDHQLKAAFLVQFVKYTQWPKSDANQIVVGVLGGDTFGVAFNKYQGRRFHGKNLVIRNIDNISEAKTCCQMIFIGLSERDRIGEIIHLLAGQPILTVSEVEGFIDNGGMIGLVRKGTKLKFAANTKVANKAGLGFSPRMLHIALPEGK